MTYLADDALNILLVDDQPGKLLGYQAILESLGQRLLLASNGREALEHLLKNDVAVILMDVCMPEQDGFELVELIRQHHRFRDTAVIFVSAVQMTDVDLIKGYQSGAVDYVSVPIIPEILRAKVEVFVDLHRKTRALERMNLGLEARVNERTAELQESEMRFRLMADTIPSLIWTADREGNLSYANERFQQYIGETIVREGHWLFDAIHPEDRDHCLAAWEEAIACAAPLEIEHRTKAQDGTYRWYLTRALPQFEQEGQLGAWFGVSTDIELQKQAATRVKDSERLYKAIGDSLDFGIWIADTTGRNLYTSDSFLNLLGITQEECAAGVWTERIIDKGDAAGIQACAEAMSAGEPFSRELWFLGADGHEHPVLSRGVPIKDAEGNVVSWVGINLDIAQMKDAENSLREADRRKDEFLATLAHELRNPLAPIKSGLDLMRIKGDDPVTLRDLRAMLERQVNQMVRLVDDLLDVSRITRGALTLQMSETNLADVIRASVETSMPGIASKSHDLQINLPNKPLMLLGDATRLAQVFSNLLNNAARYTPPSGSISIGAEVDGSYAVVRVTDNGIGFDPEKASVIFDMFTQVDKDSRTGGGLGIGLTLAKRLIELHDGEISAASMGPDMGSTFEVKIPLAEVRSVGPAESARADTGVDALRIVIADDNEDAAYLLKLMLTALGHEVVVGNCGVEAVRLVEEFDPHVAILDIGMPNMNGYEAARHIRREGWGQTVFLIALTGWGQPEDRRQTMEAGFNRHLTKPADVQNLTGILKDDFREWSATAAVPSRN